MDRPCILLTEDKIIRLEAKSKDDLNFEDVCKVYAELHKKPLQEAEKELRSSKQEGKHRFPVTFVGNIEVLWLKDTHIAHMTGGDVVTLKLTQDLKVPGRNMWLVSPEITDPIYKKR